MATAGALSGTGVYLSVYDGADWVPVGGQVAHTETLTNELVDITNKIGSADFRELLPDQGLQSISYDVDLIFNSQSGFVTLRALAGSKEVASFRLMNKYGIVIQTITLKVLNFVETSPNAGTLAAKVTLLSSTSYTYGEAGTYYVVIPAVHFDGTTRYYRGLGAGVTQNKKLTFIAWLSIDQTGKTHIVGDSDQAGFLKINGNIKIDSSGGFVLSWVYYPLSGSSPYSGQVSLVSVFTVIDTFHHIAISIDLSDTTNKKHFYLDGVDKTGDASWTVADKNIDWQASGSQYFGWYNNAPTYGSSDGFLGCMGQLILTNGYINLDTNIATFYDNGPKLVAVDAIEATDALIYLDGTADTWDSIGSLGVLTLHTGAGVTDCTHTIGA